MPGSFDSVADARAWAGRITMIAVGLGLVAGFLIWKTRDREPEWKDRPLSAWVRQLQFAHDGSEREREAADAIRSMGREAIPHLREILNAGKTPEDVAAGIPTCAQGLAIRLEELVKEMEKPSTGQPPAPAR